MLREPSFEDFKRWVDEQPKGKRYYFMDIHECALAQYGRACIGVLTTAGSLYFRDENGREVQIIPYDDKKIDLILYQSTTFGELAAALKELPA